MKRLMLTLLILCFSTNLLADQQSVINIYGWSGIIPDEIIHQFEKETGIKVNFSTYDNNEIMYAKLRANNNSGYDLIEPSSYYVDRMRKQGMLEAFDKTKLHNFHNMNPEFLNHDYDPQNHFSIPLDWGITGIFVNDDYYQAHNLQKWSDLWDKQYHDQLMLLDDSREVFSFALLALGYSPNDIEPAHIKQAYQKLQELMPNVKLFSSDAVVSILIDEDASIGMAWNGDVFKSHQENHHLQFIYPKEGFIIWVDSFAIPKNAPHLANAYRFLDFVMRPDIAKTITLYNNYPTTNSAAQKILPDSIRNNPVVYPPHEILKHGQYQTDISDDALAVYEKYWEQLKMGG